MKLNPRPFISVVLTTHSRPFLLERALKSLLQQTFKDFEIILCADESEKNTKEMATKYLRPCDSFISSPHMTGPSESRNLGILLSRGQWVCFLDDDDTFKLNHFENFLSFDNKSDEIFFGNYTKINETIDENHSTILSKEDMIITENSTDILYVSNFIPINAILMPINIAKQYNFDMNLETHEDWEYFIRLKSCGYNFKGIHALSGANVHLTNSPSRNKGKSIPLDYLSIYRMWPSKNEEIKKIRANILNKWGLEIPDSYL